MINQIISALVILWIGNGSKKEYELFCDFFSKTFMRVLKLDKDYFQTWADICWKLNSGGGFALEIEYLSTCELQKKILTVAPQENEKITLEEYKRKKSFVFILIDAIREEIGGKEKEILWEKACTFLIALMKEIRQVRSLKENPEIEEGLNFLKEKLNEAKNLLEKK